MVLSLKVYNCMMHLPLVPPETGGILGEKGGVICSLYLDQKNQSKQRAIYSPDVKTLNKVICRWAMDDICFAGMFHSHFPNQCTLSIDDKKYIESIFHSIPISVESLFFPLVIPEIKILPFKAVRTESGILINEDTIIIKRSV